MSIAGLREQARLAFLATLPEGVEHGWTQKEDSSREWAFVAAKDSEVLGVQTYWDPWEPPSPTPTHLYPCDQRGWDLWASYDSATTALRRTSDFADRIRRTYTYPAMHETGDRYKRCIATAEQACVDARRTRDLAYERLSAHRDIPVILGCFQRMRVTTCAGGTKPIVLPTACAIEILRFLYPHRVKH